MNNPAGIALPTTTIECGIGKIEYCTDNLLLEQLMDALQEQIQQSDPITVLRILQPLVTA